MNVSGWLITCAFVLSPCARNLCPVRHNADDFHADLLDCAAFLGRHFSSI